jgi:predicted PurR-regulated permease PerM
MPERLDHPSEMTRDRPRTTTVGGMPEPEVGRVPPLWLTVLLGIAGAGVALWSIHAAAPILGPVVLAFVLTVVAHPIVTALVRRGMRRGLAVAVAVLVVDGGLIAFALALAFSFGRLATVLPEYADEWQALLDDLRSVLTGIGIGPEQVDAALQSIQLRSVVSAVGGVVAGLAGSLTTLLLVLATVLFMTAEGAGLPERLAGLAGTQRLHAALGDFARNTRRYIVVTTIFGLLVAIVDTVALVALGIPLALLWGLVSFLTNYVPNIGFFLGLAPPTLLALLVGGPGLAALVIAIYVAANFVIQSVIQPVFVGDAVGLSVTLSFLSVFVWTVVLGPMGAVLAIPLTLFAHAILVGHDPDRLWARTLLAGVSGAAPARRRAGRGRRSRRAAVPADPTEATSSDTQAAETDRATADEMAPGEPAGPDDRPQRPATSHSPA